MVRKTFSADLKSTVAIEALKGHKTISELSSEFGVHVTQINAWKKHLLESSKDTFTGKKQRDMNAVGTERDRLYAQIGKSQVELEWVKKSRTSRLSSEDKRAVTEPTHPTIKVMRQSQLIGPSSASYYRATTFMETDENLELMRLIDEEYMRHPFYGSRKLRD